ncbi:hypothetical protein D8674_000287 [Pyrus ussuriensis x Pyrus communis]|uniref:Uncharacterized protein n=1 Tax=Pyrus ussuriensis x Pyrus communis TaxID=2448454 RepID=A0A5N5F318_9ROSA|nr:hypothetical protein D8674_000287 [Pyrus ussuriensis x Pyrus communis]
MNEYCSFHKSTNHAIEGCRMLRDHIDELLDQGHCWDFARDKARKKGLIEPKDRDYINCIYGGHRTLRNKKAIKWTTRNLILITLRMALCHSRE